MKFFNFKSSIFNFQSGQTLIETMVALFILSMGVSAAAGLAVYAFSTSTSINKQIIGVGLAREAIEAVRNMRDTNWLNDIPNKSTACYDYLNTQSDATCYPDWLGKNSGVNFYCLRPSNGGSCNGNSSSNTYILGLNSPVGNYLAVWNLPPSSNYGMTLQPSATTTGTGFYVQTGTVCGQGANQSGYCRKITITNFSKGNHNANNPPYSPVYNQDDNLSLLYVQSQVWWVDKKCPLTQDWPGAGSCSVELDTYLTNWKNY